jgi:hypothetical protein
LPEGRLIRDAKHQVDITAIKGITPQQVDIILFFYVCFQTVNVELRLQSSFILQVLTGGALFKMSVFFSFALSGPYCILH